MKTADLIVLALVTGLGCPAPVFAANPTPDIKGQWVGKTYSIIAGHGAHWPSSKGSFQQPALAEKDLMIEITGQQDRRFWGATTISGNGEKTQEPFIGELTGRNNTDVIIADNDGYIKGTINGNVLSFCYAQAGGAGDTPAVVSCSEVRRKR